MPLVFGTCYLRGSSRALVRKNKKRERERESGGSRQTEKQGILPLLLRPFRKKMYKRTEVALTKRKKAGETSWGKIYIRIEPTNVLNC